MRPGPKLRDWGKPRRTAREFKKYWEQSQNVDENKAHHFFEWCKSGAFGSPSGTNLALKGARTIWENEVRLDRRKARQKSDNLSARQAQVSPATPWQK
jgi:hypothetical protein